MGRNIGTIGDLPKVSPGSPRIVSLMVFKFTQLIRNEIKMAMFTMNIETGNLLEAKEGRFDTFDSWGLELEFRRRGCFEHWDKKKFNGPNT